MKNLYRTIAILLLVFTTQTLAAQVRILSPGAGDSLIVGEEITIRWENNTENPVSLYYSNNGGNTWENLADDILENEFTWKIPYLSEKGLLFKVEENIMVELRRIWENPLAHSDEIKNCEFSNDGKYFLTSSDDRYFRIWDIAGQRIHTEFLHSIDTLFAIRCAQFWGEGIDSVIYCWYNGVFLWNRQTNSSEKLFDMEYIPHFVTTNYASGNLSVCSQSNDDIFQNSIVIYSLKERRILKEFNNPSSPNDSYYRIRYSPSGKYIAFVGYNKVVNVYDVEQDELHNYQVLGGTMAMMGVDFSFDEREIVVCGLDGVIRRFSLPNVEPITLYTEIASAHSRSIRFVSSISDFICGGVGSYTFVYGNLNRRRTDSIDVGYQITDVNFYKSKYYLVAGREPRTAGKFTLFELYFQPSHGDSITCNAFYKFHASLADQKAKYGDLVTFEVNFEHNYLADSLPFFAIDARVLVGLPYQMLDVSPTLAEPYEPPAKDVIYKIQVENILQQHNYNSLKGRILLTSQRTASLYFDTCYSSNNMILFDTSGGELEILDECPEGNGRFVVNGVTTSMKVADISSAEKNIEISLGGDDEHLLTIVDMKGSVVLRQKFNKSGTYNVAISANEFGIGTYFLQLNSSNKVINDKLILILP